MTSTKTERTSSVTESVVSWKLAIGWGLGTLGISIMFNTINVLMQRYATDFLGVAAATWGMIYLVSKIYDAITDPLMGVLSDRTRSRWGRRRPYLLLGGVLCAIVFFSLFNVPELISAENMGLALFILMFLYSTAYTVFNVPYMAMPAEMTDSYQQRSFLVSFRVYAIGLGTIAGISAAPLLVKYFGGGHVGHQMMAAVYAVIIFLATAFCFKLTSSAKQTLPDNVLSMSRQLRWRAILDNRPFLLLIAVKFFQLAALALSQAVMIYFIVYVLNLGYGFLGIYGLVVSLCMLFSPPFFLLLLKRFSKRNVFIAVSMVYALVLLTWMFSSSDEAISILIIRSMALGICSGGMLLMGQAMLPDTIAHDFEKTGLRREGLFAGIYTTAEKLAFAVGGALSGLVLGYMGYVSSNTGGAVQPDSAITAIYWCMSILPALLTIISCVFLLPYRLDEGPKEKRAVL